MTLTMLLAVTALMLRVKDMELEILGGGASAGAISLATLCRRHTKACFTETVVPER
jgi:hypothetical protein